MNALAILVAAALAAAPPANTPPRAITLDEAVRKARSNAHAVVLAQGQARSRTIDVRSCCSA